METKDLIGQLSEEKRCILNNIPHTSGNIIDIGCGSGNFAFCISKLFPKSKVLAVDGDEEFIKKAKGTYKNSNLLFEYCDITDIKKKNFDLVIFSEVIEHLPNVGNNLDAINRLTADKGILFVTTDNAFYLNFLLSTAYRSYVKLPPTQYLWHHQKDGYHWWNHHLYSWTLNTLSTLMSLYGYELQEYWFTQHFSGKTFKDKISKLICGLIPAFRPKIVLKLCKVNKPTIVEKTPKQSFTESQKK